MVSIQAAMPSSPFFKVEEVLAQLTLKEKVELLSGLDFWHTIPVTLLGVPSIRMSDGPNGVRGTRFFNGVTSSCFPCATALASTFDKSFLEQVGQGVADECTAKGVHVWLAPTINTQRSPLGGRGFEPFSEDPVLQGWLGSAIIKGVQSNGVSATQKHYVANDCEHNRWSSNSQVSEKALREIYLKPFEIVCSASTPEAVPWATMTAYNHLHASEHKRLLDDILRKEWGWNGLIMSDWLGIYSAVEALRAGLEIEMPGPPTVRGDCLFKALNCGKLHPSELDAPVRNILNAVKRAQDYALPFDGSENVLDTPAVRELHRAATDLIVLLKNDNDILPLSIGSSSESTHDYPLSVIGPNSKLGSVSGGGSAGLRSTYTEAIFDAIVQDSGLDPAQIGWMQGCYSHKMLPSLSNNFSDKDGKEGQVTLSFYSKDPTKNSKIVPVHQVSAPANQPLFFVDGIPDHVPFKCYALVEAMLTPEIDGEWELGIYAAGRADLHINNERVIDNSTNFTPGYALFNSASAEVRSTVLLQAGKSYDFKVTFSNHVPLPTATPFLGRGGIGFEGCVKAKEETLRQKAVDLAKRSTDVVLVVGLNKNWESEGYDRETLALPPGTDELISAVLEVNTRTVLVIQSGTPVSMPWLASAKTVVQAWYGGNAYGSAVSSVLFEAHNPHARLPLSYPIKDEDTPTHFTFPETSHNGLYGTVEYVEGSHVGYRHYDLYKPVAFAFGHGLSYTSFEWSQLELTNRSPLEMQGNEKLEFTTTVTNTGDREGKEVVQLYFERNGSPVKELKDFAITRSPSRPARAKRSPWRSDHPTQQNGTIPSSPRAPGSSNPAHTLSVSGRSSRNLQDQAVEFSAPERLAWTGLIRNVEQRIIHLCSNQSIRLHPLYCQLEFFHPLLCFP